MNAYAKTLAASLIAIAALAGNPLAASAMPAASKDAVAQSNDAAGLQQAHAVWVCRYGHCWWSHTGHYHGGWGRHGGWGHHGGWGGHHGGHHGHW